MARQEISGWHNDLLHCQILAICFEAGDAKSYLSLYFETQAQQYTFYIPSETTGAV